MRTRRPGGMASWLSHPSLKQKNVGSNPARVILIYIITCCFKVCENENFSPPRWRSTRNETSVFHHGEKCWSTFSWLWAVSFILMGNKVPARLAIMPPKANSHTMNHSSRKLLKNGQCDMTFCEKSA
jgi:hypothetical protein